MLTKSRNTAKNDLEPFLFCLVCNCFRSFCLIYQSMWNEICVWELRKKQNLLQNCGNGKPKLWLEMLTHTSHIFQKSRSKRVFRQKQIKSLWKENRSKCIIFWNCYSSIKFHQKKTFLKISNYVIGGNRTKIYAKLGAKYCQLGFDCLQPDVICQVWILFGDMEKSSRGFINFWQTWLFSKFDQPICY